ncbi:hypothetical protein [Sagittula salina]|uniref:Holin of 3TMs, for gene-transfer release n=1 Tax=Sagittula salina TaxID=2820268 RepID=A0A940MP98_9RHOB|nr:hypothetical protein [Sagittula salina]MBP0481647.1 hypothetical protein [Sagittula salina]
MTGPLARLLAWLVRAGFAQTVEAALARLDQRAELLTDRERIQAETTAVLAREAVAEARIMADFNARKLSFPWFWIFAAAFVGPLALWWSAVILDSVFGFAWSVADLPTPQMQAWAGDMIRWTFYVGGGVGALRALR